MAMAIPPPIGVGVEWTLRSPGRSINPQRGASRLAAKVASQATNMLGTIAPPTNQIVDSRFMGGDQKKAAEKVEGDKQRCENSRHVLHDAVVIFRAEYKWQRRQR
jgi:hypothetical protein